MKIVHVINSLATGGAETMLVDLAQTQAARGHDVTIAVLCDAPGIPRRRAEAGGLRVVALSKTLHDPRLPARLAWAARHADVVHAHLFPSLYVAAAAPLRARRIYTEHSTSNRRRDRPLFRALDRLAYARYDAVIAISRGTAEALTRHFARIGVKASPVVVTNGLAPDFFARTAVDTAADARRRDAALRLIFVGTLDERKDPLLAIEAMARLADARLTILGDGPLRSAVEERVSRLGLGDRIELVGRRADVRDLLDRHDAVLSTSRHEGFGIAVLEAAARGLPAVAPDVPGLREVVVDGGTGLLYDPAGGAKAVAAAVSRLARDPALVSRLSAAAASRARCFDIGSTVDGYERVYLDVVGRG